MVSAVISFLPLPGLLLEERIGFLLFWAFLASAPFAFHSNILSILFLPPVVTAPSLSSSLSLSLSLSPPPFFVQCRDCGKQVYLGKFHSCPSCPCPYLGLLYPLRFNLAQSQLRGYPVSDTWLQADLTPLMRRRGMYISTDSHAQRQSSPPIASEFSSLFFFTIQLNPTCVARMVRAYDRAAIKFRGVEADINFSLEDYEDDMKQMGNLSKEEFVHVLRRQSTGFPRGSSKYRGVTLHKCGRWEARMGQFLGKKYASFFLPPYCSISSTSDSSCSIFRSDSSCSIFRSTGWEQVRLLGAVRHRGGSRQVKLLRRTVREA